MENAEKNRAGDARNQDNPAEQRLTSRIVGREETKRFEDSFIAYFKLHYDSLAKVAYSITGSWDAAGEAVDDAFLALQRQLGKKGFAAGSNSLAAWLMKATRNNSLAYLRRSRARRTVSLKDLAEPIAEQEDSPVEGQEVTDELWRCVGQLPEQQRRVVMLRVVQGLEFNQIWAELGIQPRTARSYYSLAVNKLQRMIKM